MLEALRASILNDASDVLDKVNGSFVLGKYPTCHNRMVSAPVNMTPFAGKTKEDEELKKEEDKPKESDKKKGDDEDDDDDDLDLVVAPPSSNATAANASSDENKKGETLASLCEAVNDSSSIPDNNPEDKPSASVTNDSSDPEPKKDESVGKHPKKTKHSKFNLSLTADVDIDDYDTGK